MMSQKLDILFGIAVASILIAPISAAAKPATGTLETYRDWTIGCDNGGNCQASSLAPDDDQDWEHLTEIFISRTAQPTAQPSITFHLQTARTGQVDVMVDGAKVTSVTAKEQSADIQGVAAFSTISALSKGNSFELQMNGKAIAHASLSGSAAALRYMDAKQGRAGTISALVAKGPLGLKAMKTPSALPIVRRVAVPTSAGATLWRSEMTQALKITQCGGEMATPGLDTEVHPLSSSQSLVLVACGSGAYNFNSVPLIATGTPGRRTFAFAKFDMEPGWQGDSGPPMLINANWLAKKSSLSSYAKGRGIGDCGSSQTYAWDGKMFRMTEATSMGECRGAWNWITVYKAQVVLAK